MSSDAIGQVVAMTRTLRLPHMRRVAPELLITAKAQRWEPSEVLRALLAEEVAGRAASSIRIRRKAAGFPTGKTFDIWDDGLSLNTGAYPEGAAQPGVDRAQGEPGRLRPLGHRQDSFHRGPRSGRSRCREKGLLVFA